MPSDFHVEFEHDKGIALASNTGRDWLRLFSQAVRLDHRLSVLHAFGITDSDLSKATGVPARTLRRWRTAGTPTTNVSKRWEPIDDLIAIIRYFLADGSYNNETILAWLRSRNPALEHRRPLDGLANDFSSVLGAAEGALRYHRGGTRNEERSFFAAHPPATPEPDPDLSTRHRRGTRKAEA